MRTLPCLILSLFFLHEQVECQVRFGLTGGGLYTSNTLVNERYEVQTGNQPVDHSIIYGHTNGQFSAYGGITADINLTKNFSLSSKFLFSAKGWQENVQLNRDSDYIHVESTTYKETYKLNYAELPLYFTFYAPLKTSKLFLSVGAYLSYGLYGQYKINTLSTNLTNLGDTTTNIIFTKESNPETVHANKWDYGAYVGAGIEFRNRLFVNASFTVGLRDVLTDRYQIVPNRNKVLAVGLGYYMNSLKIGALPYSQFKLGLRAGALSSVVSLISFSYFDADKQQLINRKPLYSFYSGVVFDLNLGKAIVLHPSINWINKGVKIYHYISDGLISRSSKVNIATYNISYIEVPLDVLYIIPTGRGKIYIGAGPYFSYALKGKTIFREEHPYEFIGQPEVGEHKLDKNMIHHFDVGLHSIMGYEFSNGLFTEAGFSLGITETLKQESIFKSLGIDRFYSRYRVFQLGMGYFFNRLWPKHE